MSIAINGFGRIGRLLARAFIQNNNSLTLINGVSDAKKALYYLKYDSNHGLFNENIIIENNNLKVNNNNIQITNKRDKAPNWSKLGIKYLIDCTGKIKLKEDCALHFDNGIEKIILSHPFSHADRVIVMGVNDNDLTAKDKIISASSCTTNCLAQIVKILEQECTILSGFFSTVHALTNDQALLDKNHKDLRRSRSAIESIIPTSTGAANEIAKLFPRLQKKLQGKAYRVNTKNVSLVELTCKVKKGLDIEKLNSLFLKHKSKYFDISNEPLVSIDYNHTSFSCVVDALLTKSHEDMIQISAWYDNEWAYALRLLDIYNLANAL